VNTALTFDVPPNTGSFTIVEQAVSASPSDVTFGGVTLHNVPLPLRILEPNGSVFFDDTSGVPADFSAANAVYYGGKPLTGAFTVPNTTHAATAFIREVPAGTWSFVVGDYAAECNNVGAGGGCTSGGSTSGVYDATVLLRPGPVPSTATIDLDVYLVSLDPTLQASTAPANPGLGRMLSTLSSIYAEAGLCVGRVTYLDVPQWARLKYATGVDSTLTGPCDDLSQLFTLSRSGTALQIFLVDDILTSGVPGTGGLRTVGIDGTIPGLSTIGGTIVSGAVVNASDIGHGTCGNDIDLAHCGSDEAAAIVAHEAGHWLGLYHPTERNGTVFDPVSDTGVCVCSQCVAPVNRPSCGISGPAAAMVTNADCTAGGKCSGGDNLMFWLVGGQALTAGQGQIMRANPATR
jgi:hypothetical protein